MTLRTSIALLVAAAVLPVVIFAALLTVLLTRHEQQTFERGARETTRAMALATARELDLAVTSLETLATSPALDRPDLTPFREQADRLRRSRHGWSRIFLADPAGQTIFSTAPPPGESHALEPGREIAWHDQEFFQRVLRERRPAVSDLITGGRGANGSTIVIAVPVQRQGQITHVLATSVEPLALVETIDEDQLRAGWGIRVFDSKRTTVAQRPLDPAVVGQREGPLAEAIRAAGGGEGEQWVRLVTRTGVPAYVAFTPLPRWGWGIAIAVPAAPVEAPGRRSMTITVGGGLALLSVGLGLAILIGRRIASPIGELAHAADALGRREPVAVPTSALREVGDLARAVRQADDTLRERAEERKLLDAELRRRAEELEQANHVKDEFLATVSHELRSPLNAILGWTRILSAGPELQPSELARALDTIHRNARLQSQLIDDLLDLSRIVSGQLRLEVKATDLRAVISSALDVVRPAADAKGITLEADAPPTHPTVLADPDRLQQILWNLLSNAIRFTPGGGRVGVTLRTVDAEVHVAVADTGEGIRPDFLPHVFERFRRDAHDDARAHNGLGLGLAIVRHLVELQGGRVWAESDGAGRGATFTFSLPLKTVPAV